MASEEAKFAARANRLAGRQGVAGFMPAAARTQASQMPTNRYIMPQFVEKTPYGMKTQDAYSRLFEDRIIFLGVQVDDASADDVMAQLLVLESQDPNRDVMMYINSPGGSMTAMTAIYDTMQYIKPDVQTVCLGQAASAAAILLASGTKGKRLMLPNARVLIHQPAIDQGFGKATEIEIQAKEMLRMREWLENTLAKHTGQDVEKIRRDIEVDTFLTAPEAKEYGIVDEVLEHRQ
ncbi:ATP-dependent Clp protease proteolytic subunit [Bifidobacterium felsineum]|uniref:ATP-dependent Clp protease proteolytic subunit n=1 Tax=Bifidobacterium felsineum TaxID=2045440 RepID=UPI001BDD12BE|nr:ATP-dependent Clp protease proteolytic subunit [Bifidobacterium felsineum]MBT1163532.1 ATP-dependent Clp protease proteolytic subunit [Bifidobacterium felsineum]